jgi:hypothetical protein
MRFNSLTIESPKYGDHKDKIIATLEIQDPIGKMELVICDDAALKIMAACAEIVARAAADRAEDFRREFVKSLGLPNTSISRSPDLTQSTGQPPIVAGGP